MDFKMSKKRQKSRIKITPKNPESDKVNASSISDKKMGIISGITKILNTIFSGSQGEDDTQKSRIRFIKKNKSEAEPKQTSAKIKVIQKNAHSKWTGLSPDLEGLDDEESFGGVLPKTIPEKGYYIQVERGQNDVYHCMLASALNSALLLGVVSRKAAKEFKDEYCQLTFVEKHGSPLAAPGGEIYQRGYINLEAVVELLTGFLNLHCKIFERDDLKKLKNGKAVLFDAGSGHAKVVLYDRTKNQWGLIDPMNGNLTPITERYITNRFEQSGNKQIISNALTVTFDSFPKFEGLWDIIDR